MLPKFSKHLDKQKTTTTHRQRQRQQATTTRRRWCCTFPLVLLSLILVLHSGSSRAEKDFNFNDSQVPLLEPKDEPIIIDHLSDSGSSSSFSNLHQHQQNHQHHDDHHEQHPYAMELSHCRYNDNQIVLSLVLKKYNFLDFNESRKAKVLKKLSTFFAIPEESITMESVTKNELFEMQKKSLKNGKKKYDTNNNRKLGRVNFIIGCGSKYFTVTAPMAKQIGQDIKYDTLDNIIGEEFGWWVIWRKPYKSRSVRNRRQIEGSGDDDADEEYDYEYEDDTQDVDTTTSNSHAHRHHHGDDTSEITSNMLEATNNKNDNNIHSNELQKIADKINGDITALKQTDSAALNENDGEMDEVEKGDSNLLLLNKKASLDEEIVESVSQLESVITKTIENTKNLDDVPDIVVDQPEDDLLSEVLQPLSPLEDIQSPAKTTDNLNSKAVYENPKDEITDDSNNNREINDPLTLATTTPASISFTTVNVFVNKSPAVVNVQENFESFTDSTTTPFSLISSSSSNNSNKHNPIDTSSYSFSPSQNNQGHSLHSSQSLEPLHTVTEITTSIMPTTTTTTTTVNSHLTPAILTDSTTTKSTHTPFASSSTFSTTSTSLSPSTPSPSSSSSSSSSSTLLPSLTKKNELNDNLNNDDDVEGAGADDEQRKDFINVNINGELLNTLTTIMAIPALTTSKSQQATTIEQRQQEQQKYQQQHHRHQYYPNYNDNSRERLRTKATTLLTTSSNNYATSSSSSSSSSLSSSSATSALDTLAIATTPPPSSSSSSSSLSSSSSAWLTTALSSQEILTPPTLELPIENVFETNIYGKKDETTVEPKDLGQASTTAKLNADGASGTTTPPPSSTTAVSQASTNAAAGAIAEAVTSTTALPDYVEPKMENTPPMIKSRLQKLAVTSGKSFKLPVPEDTFYDNEDLTNLRLELTDKEGRELKSNSWLQFNAETREIYGLPLDDAVSKWQYRLTATDSGNESVTETLEISVQQHRGVRTVNHEINVSVKINEKNMHYIDWQLNLINAIATTLGDASTNSIVVREIRASPQDSNTATLVYFNETLPTSECPERELNNLVKRIDVSRLSDLVQPILGIKSLTGQLIGPCQKTAAAKPKTPTLNIKNAPPVPRNQVDRVVATVGHLLVYKVPSDTFFDPNDNELSLSLKTKDHKELSPRHWLQFDSKNEEFYGIPKSGDTGSEEYMLVAEDAGGLTATDALVVQVNHAVKRDFSVYVKVYLAIRHEQFNADLQRKFVERIANLFGDASTQNIQIRSVTTHHDADGTIVNFYNTTLFKSHNRCPEEEMEALRNVYLQDYTVRERVKKVLGPELNITNVQVIPLGTCHTPSDTTHREFVPNKTDEPLLKSTFSDDYMYTIILPAIIIIAMILIASIIACCLHRRRRKSGKMELGDEEERKSFRTKGIPVIFQDELDEKPEIGNKSPIILKDEKPPLLPPSYNTSNMNGDNDVDEYVPPPAVVVGGREARGKSPATPSYRKPPPYVSP